MGMEKKQNAKTLAHFIAYRGMITNVSTPVQAVLENSQLISVDAATRHALPKTR